MARCRDREEVERLVREETTGGDGADQYSQPRQVTGTLIAVYGICIMPIGWKYALWMWLYALAWFVVNDVIKLAVYRRLRARVGKS